MSHLNFGETFAGSVERNRALENALRFQGVMVTEHRRRGSLIGKWVNRNVVVNEGKNAILQAFFNLGAVPAQFYMGLFDNAGFTAIAVTDTAAVHPGWAEFTAYSQATRPIWVRGAAAGQQVASTANVVFNITGSGTLKGGIISTANVKGGTGGILWAAIAYGATIAVSNGDVIRNTYAVNC